MMMTHKMDLIAVVAAVVSVGMFIVAVH